MTTRPAPRTPNLALRRARQSMRLSQAQFAEAIRAAGNAIGAPNHCTKRLVQKWETGEHATCRPDYLRVLQAVTGLAARELGFQLMPDESGMSIALSADQAQATGGDTSGEAGTAAARFAMSHYSADGMIERTMDRLRNALENPSAADGRTAGLVEVATSRLFDIEHHSPARLLVPTLERHMALVTGLLVAARHEAVRRRLTISAGQSALLAGWLEFDRGDAHSAHRLWDAAISAAQGTVDDGLFAASLIHQAYAAARRNDPAAAWQFAHTASTRTVDDIRATAWATALAAHYAARLGELDAAEEAMRRSLELGIDLPAPKPGDDTKPWMRSFDRARLMSQTAHTAALLNDSRAADYAVEAVDALGPAQVKGRAVVLAQAALTAAIVGELQLCLDYGSSAALLARDLDVSLAADLLHDVVSLVLPYSDTRPVRELLPQLARLKRTADRETRDDVASDEPAVITEHPSHEEIPEQM